MKLKNLKNPRHVNICPQALYEKKMNQLIKMCSENAKNCPIYCVSVVRFLVFGSFQVLKHDTIKMYILKLGFRNFTAQNASDLQNSCV